MTEEDLANNREFVADLVKELFNAGNLDHLDGYGGALFVLNLEDATEALRKKGWTISKETRTDGE